MRSEIWPGRNLINPPIYKIVRLSILCYIFSFSGTLLMDSWYDFRINGMVSQFFLGSTLKMDSERPYVSTYTTLFTIPKIGSQFFSSNYALLTCYYILQMCDEAFHLSLPFFQKRIYIVSYVCRRKSKELISKIYQQREHISKLKNESPKLHHSVLVEELLI